MEKTHLFLVNLPTKRENVLVYLSNSIEKYCVETGFSYDGKCQKWGPYGFGKDGRQRLEEYYPNALISTYKGVSGYIYSAETISDSGFSVQIPDVATSSIQHFRRNNHGKETLFETSPPDRRSGAGDSGCSRAGRYRPQHPLWSAEHPGKQGSVARR